MNKYEAIEFSKIYKRVLNIELTLKEKLLFAISTIYSEREMDKIVPCIQNSKNCKTYLSIINSKQSQKEKFKKFIKKAYLSDILRILLSRTIRKDRLFKNKFYGCEITNEHKEFMSNSDCLKILRNSIMHFNFFEYSSNKKKYLSCLIFWEKVLNCQDMQYLHTVCEKSKNTTTSILKCLEEEYPNFLNLSDRLVCDLFDDAAIINGWKIEELPEYWTIGRSLYNLKRTKKNLINIKK